jgi:hypothetical protein
MVDMKKIQIFLARGFDLFAAPTVVAYYQRACGLRYR